MAHPAPYTLPRALTALGGALAFTLLAAAPIWAQTAEEGGAPAAEAPAESAQAEGSEAAAGGEQMTEGEREAAQAAERLAAGETDEMTLNQAPEPHPHRVYVTDPAHFAAITQHYVLDGDTAEVLGVMDGGFLPNPVVASDGSFFAQASTVFARIARGERTDYVEVFDARTLEPTVDIELPEDPRFLVGTYPWLTALTPDNSTLLFYQFSPAPAVGMVDLEAGAFGRMINVPDCYHIFPVAEETFYMHCRDGSLAKVNFGGEGEPQIENTEVFHGEEEYVINHPAYSTVSGRLVWPTYTGKIYQINLSAENAEFLPEFEAFTEEERAEGWRPGGWQQVAYHRGQNRIYLLADQRDEWKHKTPSRFIFVIDAETGERVARLDLDHEIDSINISQDGDPQLYALSAGTQTLHVLDPETGEAFRSIDQLGHGPQIITVADMEE